MNPSTLDRVPCTSCTLYSKPGAESSGWNIKAILRGVFTILHDIPAIREDYIAITKEGRFP